MNTRWAAPAAIMILLTAVGGVLTSADEPKPDVRLRFTVTKGDVRPHLETLQKSHPDVEFEFDGDSVTAFGSGDALDSVSRQIMERVQSKDNWPTTFSISGVFIETSTECTAPPTERGRPGDGGGSPLTRSSSSRGRAGGETVHAEMVLRLSAPDLVSGMRMGIKGEDAEKVLDVVRKSDPLLDVTFEVDGNMIVARGSIAALRALRQRLLTLSETGDSKDLPPGLRVDVYGWREPEGVTAEQTTMIKLEHLSVSSAADVLRNLFPSPPNKVRIGTEPSSNTLILRGPGDQLAEFQAILLKLDQPAREQPQSVPGSPYAVALDLEAREMRLRNEGFYTIGSSGHECNAVLGRLTRHTDPAFLHYRSGAFMMERSRKVPGIDPVYDTMLSFAASSDDPISGGRHKVWGSVPLWVLPQTSTIASHLPKAVGTALGIEQAKRLKLKLPFPADSIAVCSFGDASANHSTATGAINAAAWSAYQRLPCPVLFVCEDNGIGISVRSPGGWIAANYMHRTGLHYVGCDGLSLADTWAATEEAVRICREQRRPVFLHLQLKRLMGHAGTDVELEYRPVDEVEADEARDPLLRTARQLLATGAATPDTLRRIVVDTRAHARQVAAEVAAAPKLATRAAVVAPRVLLTPPGPQSLAFLDADCALPTTFERAAGFERTFANEGLRSRYGDHCPVLIAVTGWKQASDKILANLAGFDHHVSKPYQLSELIRLLAKTRPATP
jgi:TPP-dependent pyruvate/acetoin dehydrogenase alpha subunit